MDLQWIAVRQSVLVSVFLAYLSNFCLQWIARKSHDEEISNRMRENHTYVFLYGVVGLFSCNLLQGGVWEAVSTWFVFLSLMIMQIYHFSEKTARLRSISRIVFVASLFAQCLGMLIHYAA